MNLPISAVIITLNEERNIRQCLDSIQFCDEIIVVDSGSSDNTVDIISSYNAKVIHQDWLGYGQQKQFAVNQASHDWVLCIDADEVVSPQLKQSIMNANITNNMVAAYKMPRQNHFLGKALRHGEGYPDFSLRLFNKQHCHWSNDEVHEGVIVKSGQTNKLTGDLLHFSEETLSKYIAKQNNYTQLQATMLFKQGKKYHPLKCVSSPSIRFIKFYFLRLGFLDGAAGFIHISIGCFNAFCKYAKLVELHQHALCNSKIDSEQTYRD